MSTSTHPIEPEELMAYLDGELPGASAGVVLAHLDSCEVCQKLAADLGGISQRLREWPVEETGTGLALFAASDAGQESSQAREPWFDRHLGSWAAVAACVIVVVGTIRLIGTNANTVLRSESANSGYPGEATPSDKVANLESRRATPQAILRAPQDGGVHDKNPSPSAAPISSPIHEATASTPASGPMIVRTAALGVTVQEFDKARIHLDEILARHRGYLGGLQVSMPAGQGRELNGVLRVPSGQLDSTISELKTLGRVDSESQNGQEVTAQYVDLQARLANARNTEQRLTDVLQQRTGKLSDVLAVETEIARVRGEIEGMEAERKSMATQVAFATLNVTLTEDYKPKLQTVPPSTLRQFRNSAVEGYQTMAAGVIALVNAALFYGPSILLWAALAFFPTRYGWRRLAAKSLESQRTTAS